MDEVFIPEQDITEEGPDGVARLVAAKGIPVKLDVARAAGWVKDTKKAQPQETKTKAAKEPAPPAPDAPPAGTEPKAGA